MVLLIDLDKLGPIDSLGRYITLMPKNLCWMMICFQRLYSSWGLLERKQ
jgi:hypothetical protein